MDEEREDDMKLEHYLEIGAVTIEGVDENGEIIFAINEIAKDIAPELWEAHIKHVDESLLKLYEEGFMEVEYDENLEATFNLSPEGQILAKQMGLIEMDFPEIPND
ncbi:MAG: hypothetical protein RLZZ196_906 [Bacteroidota bacterium]|jgi:hypothetical protein